MSRPLRSFGMEPEGPYLQVMQEISRTLMEQLPAEEELWRALKEAEDRLLEAQREGVSPSAAFGPGGAAAFCQSILDAHRATLGETSASFVPAAQDRSITGQGDRRHPRGGVNYRRVRFLTGMLAVLLIAACIGVALWYVGIFNYLFGGTSFYLNELHNFESRVTPLAGESVQMTVQPDTGIVREDVLFDDGHGLSVMLCGVGYDTQRKQTVPLYPEGETAAEAETTKPVKPQMQTQYAWYVRLRYAVDSSFSRVRYVEPQVFGAWATVMYPDGTSQVEEVSILTSGPMEDGYEYMYLYIGMLPLQSELDGVTITVHLPGFQLVESERISTGRR